jgi:hypothetical protein
MASGAYFRGDWDRTEAEAALTDFYRSSALTELRLARGQVELAREEFLADVEALEEGWDSEVQARMGVATQEAAILLVEGKHSDALARAEDALRERDTLGLSNLTEPLDTAGTAAAVLGDVRKLEELVALAGDVPRGHITPVFRATATLLSARLAIARGEDASSEFTASEQIFRDYGWIPYLATTLVEHGEWLASVSRSTEAEPVLAEAEEICARLRATAWLDRVARCRAGAGAAVA